MFKLPTKNAFILFVPIFLVIVIVGIADYYCNLPDRVYTYKIEIIDPDGYQVFSNNFEFPNLPWVVNSDGRKEILVKPDEVFLSTGSENTIKIERVE